MAVGKARFDLSGLDPEDPFELDMGNRPHLLKHIVRSDGRTIPMGEDDIRDLYLFGDRVFLEAREDGDADWVMIGEVPGAVLVVPLARPNSGDPSKCRPTGLYQPSREQLQRYYDERG